MIPTPGHRSISGQIEGGVGPNTVAAHAKARVETRFVSPEARKKVWEAVNTIASTPTLAGTSATLSVQVERPPMVTTDANLELFKAVGEGGRRAWA